MVPQGNVEIIITKPHKSWIFLGFFTITFKIQKVQKLAEPVLESSLKPRLNTMCREIFCCKIKKLTNFSCASKQKQVCFPLAGWHSSLKVAKHIFDPFCHLAAENANLFVLIGWITTLLTFPLSQCPNVSSRIWTLDLGIMSWVIYHCTTISSHHGVF